MAGRYLWWDRSFYARRRTLHVAGAGTPLLGTATLIEPPRSGIAADTSRNGPLHSVSSPNHRGRLCFLESAGRLGSQNRILSAAAVGVSKESDAPELPVELLFLELPGSDVGDDMQWSNV